MESSNKVIHLTNFLFFCNENLKIKTQRKLVQVLLYIHMEFLDPNY